jgi:Protein of unknown function (DUF2917)
MNLYFPNPSPTANEACQAGNWLLEAGRAITVMSRSGGQLRIARGCVWATLGAGHNKPWHAAPVAPCVMLTDYFLGAGDTLTVPAGAKVVIESLQKDQSLPVAFEWSYVPQAAQALRPIGAEVMEASSDVGHALGQVARAIRRLVSAVLAGRRSQQRLETCV